MSVNTQSILDRFSISLSVICAIHCALMPIVLTLFPLVYLGDEQSFHLIIIWLIIPSSLIACTIGCRKHKDKKVLTGIATGLAILVTAAIFGHDVLGEIGETVMTVTASLILAVSHLRNYRLCRKAECQEGCQHNT